MTKQRVIKTECPRCKGAKREPHGRFACQRCMGAGHLLTTVEESDSVDSPTTTGGNDATTRKDSR
jgi:uncharacterized phage protein